jgi:hypothetical protein
MSAIMSLIISHLLTIIENELINEEPKIVNLIVEEIQLLINKLENLIENKSSGVAAVVNPALAVASIAAVNGINAASGAIMNTIEPTSNAS